MRPPRCKRARSYAVRHAERYRERTIYFPLIVQECIVGQLVLWECEEVRGCEWNGSTDIRLRLLNQRGCGEIVGSRCCTASVFDKRIISDLERLPSF